MAREGQLVSFKLAFLNFARETHIKGKCGPRTIIVARDCGLKGSIELIQNDEKGFFKT